ncbi:hypothetical protein KGF86_03925 [Ornithinibacillus massiliensis]|uniref:Uncharacterized protein n=1 Tax=Ornithinibacillus massiliensis TaxID=1944633 RepID=A0ABS5MAL0_9BACI|nr:hypothetical protein [Ornithinibacillus massiliensis]MBS3679359.1 hypothetical protein [Ornithinibacillus massiliensis]
MKKTKISFHHLIIILILIFISSIIIWSLYKNIVLSPEHVALIMLIALVGLSFSFDKLSLGRIFSVEKKMKRVEEKQEELTEVNNRLSVEYSHFKQEMLTFMVNSMNQISNQLSNQTVTINTAANVVPASEKEKENDDEVMSYSSKESPTKTPEENEAIPTFKQEHSKLIKGTSTDLEENIERQALKQVAHNLGLPLEDIAYHVRIDIPDQHIIEKRRIYNAFLHVDGMHYFFKMMYSPFSMANVDRIQNMLNDINLYTGRNHVRAKLILILVNCNKEELQKEKDYLEKFQRRYMHYFQPALERGYLIIDTFEVKD